ncbi:unnamed protein product [Rotaria sp. Silwood1]|nr:unnamed protein product [Rotaria sp. Silwood1]
MTTVTKRKLKQTSKAKSNNKKSREKPVLTGLNGAYWNDTPVDRRKNRPAFNHDHLNDENDNDESMSESDNTLIYSNKTFLTCRSPTNSFFLCQTLQNVYSDTKQIHIRWYSFVDENQNENKVDENTHFKESYHDKIEIETILTGIESVIHHSDKTITLQKQDIIETNRLLQKSIKGESNVVKSTKSKKRKVTINSDAASSIRKRRRRTVDVDDIEQNKIPKKSKAKLFKVQSNRFLKENQAVTDYQVDPFFESNVPVPFISSSVQSKLAIRAVILNDAELLKSFIDDVARVYSVHIKRDLPKSFSAIHYAIRNNNIELLQMLVEDLLHPKSDRCSFPEVTLKKQTTGNASIRTLGFRTAEIMASRGAREGNNALLKVTPIHCAAINPNAKYLKQLLAIVSEFNLADKQDRKPIHYAAACEGPESLEYLLSKDVKFNDADKDGDTPLHIACRYGRHSNAELLLRKAKEKAESNEAEDMAEYQKYGLASINRMNTAKQCPLHLAVINNHIECAEVLIHYGATIDVFTSVSKEKLTPLMFACQHGFLDIVKYLIKHGARVEARDRFKRTPLIHACMYGHAHVVSYLLRIGANPNVFDSSMNSALHYAIAYGWYFCVRLLMEAGANMNCANCWQVSCLGIGFSKGHYGICDYLLNEHRADINFKNDEGLTVVILTVELDVSKYSVQQLEYAVVKHNADCTCVDVNGNNAFHYLASKSLPDRDSTASEKYYFRMAQILLDHHCNPTQMNNKAQTPLMLALESKNVFMVNFLINQAKVELTLDRNSDGKTFLHYFAMNSDDEKLVEILLNLLVTDDLKKMSLTLDNASRTPLQYCTLRYEEIFGSQFYSFANRLSQYQSISKMIRYFLDTLECYDETCIFHLLYGGPLSNQADQHPLEIFLKKSENINAHHSETGDTPLLRTIHAQSYTIFQMLLQQPSCDVNVAKISNTQDNGQTPLMAACELQHFPTIRDLLNHPKCDLLAYDDQHNQALHYFLATTTRSDEYLEIFHLFIEKLIAIGKHTLNSKGKSGSTPLHIAVLHNQGTVDTVNIIEQTLIDNGCDLFIKDDLGNIPLHNVFLGNKNSTDPVELCVLIMQSMNYESLDTKNDKGNTPLRLAVSKESTVCVTLLLKRAGSSSIEQWFIRTIITSGNFLDCLCNYDNRTARNPLSFESNNTFLRKGIARTPLELENPSTIIRTSPLINAVIHRNFELAKFLLQLGADVNFPDEEQLTPLMHAIRQNDLDMVKLLLNKDYVHEEYNRSSKTVSHLRRPNVQRKPKPKGFFLGATTTSVADDEDEQETEKEDISDDKEPKDESNKFKVTSNIDFGATDALGRTCIHHLVQPFVDASYVNCIEMLELLYRSGVSLTKPDRMGLSPLQYTAKNAGFRHLYEKLKELTNEQPMDTEDLTNQCFTVNDPNKNLLGLPDYYSDAQQYINQCIAARPLDNTNSIHKVDPLSNMSETGDIVWDADKNEPYDVRLTITDVDYGLIGLYNFYRMQIIKHKTKTNLYLLFTRWGRIGDGDGQHQLTPYSTLEECRAEFCKIFRDKTGNAWENTNQFEKKLKKYTLIKLSDRQTHKHTDVPIHFQRLENESEQIPSKLQSTAYKNFFKTFLNGQIIRENINKANLDVEWMPVSQLKPESLQRARDILAKLATDIEQKDKLKLVIQQTTSDDAQTSSVDSNERTELKRLIESICQLNNEYYSIIPLQGYGAERIPMIDTLAAVKIQEQKLNDIFELELSYKILLAAEANLNKISPLDYLYKSINCQFEAMNQDDIDSQFILRYIWTSAPNIKVEQILKVARSNDDERLFQQNLDNHYLLWHGTNICNLTSILIRGLLVAPLCAKSTGSLFGKGIYTADAFVKSLNYCSGVRQTNGECCFMLLCEVALGKSEDVTDISGHGGQPLDLDKYQSRRAHGHSIPDPRLTITRNFGAQMPLGQLISCTDPNHTYHRCTYNEYIVFDESQIALRYIVQFRR